MRMISIEKDDDNNRDTTIEKRHLSLPQHRKNAAMDKPHGHSKEKGLVW